MEEVFGYTESDEGMSLGLSVDFDSIDKPKNWDMQGVKGSAGVKEATVVRRILAGPFLMQSVWIPVVRKNDQGIEVASYTTFKRHPKQRGQLLDKMYTALASVNVAISVDSNQFKYDQCWVYLVFCREDEEAQVRLAEWKNTIKSQIQIHQHKEHHKNKGFLLYGPAILWDALLTKTYNPKEKGLARTNYSVTPDPESKWSGKVPMEFWNTGFKSGFDFVGRGVFTEKEMDAISVFLEKNECSKLSEFLKVYTTPNDDAQVMQGLTQTPMNPFAKKDGVPIFPDPKAFMAELVKLNIPMLTEVKDLKEPLDDKEAEKESFEEVSTEKASNPFEETEEVPEEKSIPKKEEVESAW